MEPNHVKVPIGLVKQATNRTHHFHDKNMYSTHLLSIKAYKKRLVSFLCHIKKQEFCLLVCCPDHRLA